MRPSFRPGFAGIALAFVLLPLTAGCLDSSSGGGSGSACDDFDCEALLTDLGNNIFLPTLEAFETEAQAMAQASVDYRDAVGTAEEGARKDDFQAQWRATMAVLQRLEVMQIGPLAEDSGARRDTLYSWPVTNPCGVDQDVIFADQGETPNGDPYDIESRTVDRRGMDALEYVLFVDSLDHSCPPTVSVTDGWNERPDEERIAARAEYMVLAASDVAAQAAELPPLWDGTEGDFLAELTQPGSADSRFRDAQDAVNAVSDALFYVEKQTKDTKLAEPLGLKPNSCDGAPCPQDVESPYSNASRHNIQHNLQALQHIFHGGVWGPTPDGLGFVDFLEAVGADNVASVMGTDIDDAISSVSDSNFPLTLAEALESDLPAVEGAHDANKKVTDRLKNEFLTVLGLSIPSNVGGDGD